MSPPASVGLIGYSGTTQAAGNSDLKMLLKNMTNKRTKDFDNVKEKSGGEKTNISAFKHVFWVVYLTSSGMFPTLFKPRGLHGYIQGNGPFHLVTCRHNLWGNAIWYVSEWKLRRIFISNQSANFIFCCQKIDWGSPEQQKSHTVHVFRIMQKVK